MLNQAGIEDDAQKIAVAKNIIVGTEYPPVLGERFGRRLIADVVISGDVVQRDRRVELGRDAPVLGDLLGVAGLVDEVAADHDEGGLQPVGGVDGESEIDRFLSKIAIFSEHAELRIGHLNERQVGGGSDSGDQKESSEARHFNLAC